MKTKVDLFSAFFGASFILAFFLLNSFVSPAPRRDCLTEEQAAVLNLLSVETLSDCSEGPGYTTLRVTGANLQVVNGIGYTDSVNGLGNIIVGYGEPSEPCNNSGSHNVIIGQYHAYSSHSSLVSGWYNQALGARTVVFGSGNIADGFACEVLGGVDNDALGGDGAIVIGGANNTADNTHSVVVGGQFNSVDAYTAVTLGGYGNDNTADHGVLDGGSNRSINGTYDWRAGSLFEDN